MSVNKMKTNKCTNNKSEGLKKYVKYAVLIFIILFVISLVFDTLPSPFLLKSDKVYTDYADYPGLTIDSAQKINWQIKEHPARFNLRSFTLSGAIKGDGHVRVYLDNGLHRKLVLDNYQFDSTALISITAEAVKNIAPEMENEIGVVLEYANGTSWDSDDDGIAELDDIVDLTIENTIFKEDLAEENLCTKWVVKDLNTSLKSSVCFGSESCCNFIGTGWEMLPWDTPFYAMPTDGENLEVTAQVMYIEYSLDINNPYKKTIYSESEPLLVKFIPVQNVTVTKFADIGEETKYIVDTMDTVYYDLVFEVDTGTTLQVDKIRYTLEDVDSTKTAYYQKVKDDPTFDV